MTLIRGIFPLSKSSALQKYASLLLKVIDERLINPRTI